MVELARVRRNGAECIKDIVNEFKSQSNIFDRISLFDMIQTIKYYKNNGWLIITETELILNHYC